MSKTNKKAKSTPSSFVLSFKPVPAGKVSLAEFIGSEAGQLAILCAYQTYEICNELQEVGHFDLLDDEAFQEHMVDWVESIVRENFIEMLMAVGGQLSNLLAQAEAEKGGV